jgi:hypothetical protein
MFPFTIGPEPFKAINGQVTLSGELKNKVKLERETLVLIPFKETLTFLTIAPKGTSLKEIILFG